MIYRRDNATTPSKRFQSRILNPIGSKFSKKCLYKNLTRAVGHHFGSKVCYRRKRTTFRMDFNLWRGSYQVTPGVVMQIHLARRYKTFVGLIKYSNGVMYCTPLFSGAFIGTILKTYEYNCTPKLHVFASFYTGYTIPIAYLPINSCFFNVMYGFYNFA